MANPKDIAQGINSTAVNPTNWNALVDRINDIGNFIANVKDYGAVGDDSHDDTTAIQAAIDTGRIVYLPPGTYKITARLLMDNTGQIMYGAGTGRTSIKVYGGVNGIKIDQTRCTLAKLRIYANTATQGTGTGIIIGVDAGVSSATRTLIDNVLVGATGTTEYFEKGIVVEDEAYYTAIRKCYLRYNTYGIYTQINAGTYGPNELLIDNTNILYGTYSIYNLESGSMKVRDCAFEGYTSRGIFNSAARARIVRNRFESSGKRAIELDTGVYDCYIAANMCPYSSANPPVLDNSGNEYNHIGEYRYLFKMPSIGGTHDTQHGGSITLGQSGACVTDLKLEALRGDLQLNAVASGKVVDLQADTEIAASKRFETLTPFLFTPVGGFGERAENRLLYSEEFDKYQKSGVTVTADQAIAPNGRLTADQVDSTSNFGGVYQNTSVSDGDLVWASVWVRAVSGIEEQVRFRCWGYGGATIDVSSDVSVGTTWERIEVTGTVSGNGSMQVKVYPDHTLQGSIYVWGYQLVRGSDNSPVPYIKTLDHNIVCDKPALVGADSIIGRRIAGTTRALTYAATIAADMDDGNAFTLTTTGNCTINASNGIAGQRAVFIITDDATGGRVVTFGTNFKSSGTLTGTANKIATVDFVYDGTNWCEISRTTGL